MNQLKIKELLIITSICIFGYFMYTFQDFVATYKFKNRFSFDEDGGIMQISDKKTGKMYMCLSNGYKLFFDGNGGGLSVSDSTVYTCKEIINESE